MNEVHPSDDAPVTLAPLHLRMFALLIDYLLMIVVLKLGEQAFLGSHWDLRPVPEPEPGLAVPYAWLAGLYAMIIVKDSLAGRSVGKWLTGIVVRRPQALERIPPLWQLWARNLSLVLLPLEGLLVFLDPHCRRLGDRWAGTIIIEYHRAQPLTRRLLLISALFMALLLASLLVAPWNLRRSAAYQTAVRLARVYPQLVAAVGPDPDFGFEPDLQLQLPPGGGRALVHLDAEGEFGEQRVTVTLRLNRGASRWELVGIELITEPEPETPRMEQQPAPER